MILNPNCSEAVYRINYSTAKSTLSKEEMKLLDNMIDNKEYYRPDGDGGVEYREYFEYTQLDLFLDYFDIPSQRNHWTCNATSEMERKEYDEEMRAFCITHGLPYKDCYHKRHMGDDYEGEINS